MNIDDFVSEDGHRIDLPDNRAVAMWLLKNGGFYLSFKNGAIKSDLCLSRAAIEAVVQLYNEARVDEMEAAE